MTGSGVLLVDKPPGMSSAAVVGKIRRCHSIEKIGHGGTLDPFASGLLVLLLGEGTKIARFLLEGHKAYEAAASTLHETDTEDHTGRRLQPSDGHSVPEQFLRATIPSFLGRISQVPPKFSALKKDGRPLYELAREGKDVTPEPREVEIHSLELLAADAQSFRFRVECGGGTYIRSLARDWAKAAGGCAHLTSLRRTRSNQFTVEEALPLSRILEIPDLPLISIADALLHLPKIACESPLAEQIRRGHPRSKAILAERWIAPPGFALALEGLKPVAVLRREAVNAEVVLERVFDPAAL